MRGRILNAAIVSHLLVAVPPAVLLGLMVASINEDALRYEAQLLHLSTASRMREALEGRVQGAVAQLEHAERVLAIEALPFSDRQDLLRALVASGNVPHLIVFRPDGGFDAAIADEPDAIARAPLDDNARAAALAGGYGLGRAREDGTSVVAVPWEGPDGLRGFLGTTVDPAPLQEVAAELAATYLGPRGEVTVVDAGGRRVVGSLAPRPGADGLAGTPFEGLSLSGASDGLASLAAGISKDFVDAEGTERLAAVVSDPDLGWIVGTSRPTEVALESIDRVHQRVLLMSLAAALAAGLVGLLLARRITSPIQALVASVRRAAKANFAPERQVRAAGELGQLAQAFNAAVAELAKHRLELQQTTQLRLRLSRLVSSAAVHEALAGADDGATEEKKAAVTVLYADVVLPTDRKLDTEHLVTVLSEFFGAANDTIRKHKGVVDRFSGDALIGIFSGPNPEGALAAARELVADAEAVSERWSTYLGGPLSASAALATGQATLRRSAESGELSAAGPVVERAAGGQAAATAREILLDPDSRAGVQAEGSPRSLDDVEWLVTR